MDVHKPAEEPQLPGPYDVEAEAKYPPAIREYRAQLRAEKVRVWMEHQRKKNG